MLLFFCNLKAVWFAFGYIWNKHLSTLIWLYINSEKRWHHHDQYSILLTSFTLCIVGYQRMMTSYPVWQFKLCQDVIPRVKPTLRIQLLSWYKWFNKYTYLVIHGETYWFFSRNTGIIFSKKGVNFNHYINLLKVRFKVYKMCTLKETSVRFLILMVRHHVQGYIYKFAKSSQVHFSLL